MGKEPWYESDDPGRVARGAGWRTGVVVLCVIAFFGVVGIGIWGFRVATSDTKGRGDATVIKNEAGNRIRAQEGFEKDFAEIKAADRRIAVLDEAAKGQPAGSVAVTNATSARTYCITLVGEYDARARSFTQEDFRAADLPRQIDQADPATDCKGENGR